LKVLATHLQKHTQDPVLSQKFMAKLLSTVTLPYTFVKAQDLPYTFVKAQDLGAKYFTDVAAFFTHNKSPLCAGALTDLTQIAVAKGGALGQSFSVASSGASTSVDASVQGEGTSLNYVSGMIVAHVKSLSCAGVIAAAQVLAEAYSEASNESFAEVCVATIFPQICRGCANACKGICAFSAREACSTAEAKGEAHAKALAKACVEATVSSWADAETNMILSANVVCGSTPKLAWTCANAGFGQSCQVSSKKHHSHGIAPCDGHGVMQ
jgi:hypothetical protein